jgi:hypothetical protein
VEGKIRKAIQRSMISGNSIDFVRFLQGLARGVFRKIAVRLLHPFVRCAVDGPGHSGEVH